MTRILVCGDREWTARETIERVLAEYPRECVIIHGAARGADRLAAQAARTMGFKDVVAFPADWTRYGKAAGVIRNQQMLIEGKPDFVLAFHNRLSQSKGTKDMVDRATRAGIPYRVISRRAPENFLEQHALAALTAEPSWTVSMYGVFNDLTDDTIEELREFLRYHLPTHQITGGGTVGKTPDTEGQDLVLTPPPDTPPDAEPAQTDVQDATTDDPTLPLDPIA